jgi:hypothetical protein
MAQGSRISGGAPKTAAEVVREPGPAVNTYLQRVAYLRHPAVRKALAWEGRQRKFDELKAGKAKY